MRSRSPPATLFATNSADTFADGMATRVPDEEALAVIRSGAARIVLVSDDEIAAAIRAYWTDTHNLAEGAGAAALAAAMKERARLQGAQGRPRALGRQHRFRPVPALGGARAERRRRVRHDASGARRRTRQGP